MDCVKTMVLLASTSGCLITDPIPYVGEAPLTPPRIVDQAGVTRPRLGNVVIATQVPYTVEFRIPVEDDGLTDPIEFEFFVDQARECIDPEIDGGADGGVTCEPNGPTGTVEPDGTLRRIIRKSVPLSRGCHRIELWVTSSRFPQRGNYHTPSRAGDVAFASWWVFVPEMSGGSVDVSTCTPVQP